ncbi:unnamed protein product [Caenorhabditis brenneri]
MFYPSNRGFICELCEASQEAKIFDFAEHKLTQMSTQGTKGLNIGQFVKTDGKRPVRFDVNEISSDGWKVIVDESILFVRVVAVCPTKNSLAKELCATYAKKAFSPFLGHLGDSTGLLDDKFKLGKRVEVIVKYSPNEELGTVFDVQEVVDSPNRYEELLRIAEAKAAKKIEDAKRRAEAKKNPGSKVAPVKRGVQKKAKGRVMTRAQAAKAAAESAQKS